MALARGRSGATGGDREMDKFFGNLGAVVAIGALLAIGLMFAPYYAPPSVALGLFQWLHVFFGIVWIGLLYYFNFVQIPTMPKIPAELKPGVSKHIAPAALFYFRWAAALTVLTGLILAHLYGELHDAMTLDASARLIGIGMYLALIMAFNVWFIIWPNQQKALGLVPADDAVKAKAARTAMITSRINTLLSLPMLLCMVAYR
jgi:uncharacterized membrane protein